MAMIPVCLTLQRVHVLLGSGRRGGRLSRRVGGGRRPQGRDDLRVIARAAEARSAGHGGRSVLRIRRRRLGARPRRPPRAGDRRRRCRQDRRAASRRPGRQGRPGRHGRRRLFYVGARTRTGATLTAAWAVATRNAPIRDRSEIPREPSRRAALREAPELGRPARSAARRAASAQSAVSDRTRPGRTIAASAQTSNTPGDR